MQRSKDINHYDAKRQKEELLVVELFKSTTINAFVVYQLQNVNLIRITTLFIKVKEQSIIQNQNVFVWSSCQ